MAGKHERQLQPAGHESSHIARIGVMGMDPIGQAGLGLQLVAKAIGKVIEEGPKKLLTQIAPGPEGNPPNQRTRTNQLRGLAVVQGDPLIKDLPG